MAKEVNHRFGLFGRSTTDLSGVHTVEGEILHEEQARLISGVIQRLISNMAMDSEHI